MKSSTSKQIGSRPIQSDSVARPISRFSETPSAATDDSISSTEVDDTSFFASSEEAEIYDITEKVRLQKWFLLRMKLVNELADELWTSHYFSHKSEQRVWDKKIKEQMKNCTEEGSLWVIHETPKFLKDFEIVKEIEHGLESRISLVKHRSTTIVYTMRSIHKTKMLQQYRKELFKLIREELGILLVAMDFESMVNILAVYEDRWDVHVIMDVAVEGDLETLLLDGVLSRTENEIHDIFVKLLQSVYPLHKLSRSFNDISLERILVNSYDKGYNSGSGFDIVLADFGLIRSHYIKHKNGLLSHENYFYSSPEDFEGNPGIPADTWALGCVLFMLTFHFPPFFSLKRSINKFEKQVEHFVCKTGFQNVIKPGYGYWFPEKYPIHTHLRHLIANMLVQDPQKRMTVLECFHHPWVQNRYEKLDVIGLICTDVFEFQKVSYMIRIFCRVILEKQVCFDAELIEMHKFVYQKFGMKEKPNCIERTVIDDHFWKKYEWDRNEDLEIFLASYRNKEGNYNIEKLIEAKCLMYVKSHPELMKTTFESMVPESFLKEKKKEIAKFKKEEKKKKKMEEEKKVEKETERRIINFKELDLDEHEIEVSLEQYVKFCEDSLKYTKNPLSKEDITQLDKNFIENMYGKHTFEAFWGVVTNEAKNKSLRKNMGLHF